MVPTQHKTEEVQMEKVKNEEYVNDIDAAKFLKLCPQTMRNWRVQSKGPAYIKAGRCIRYAIEDLRAFMNGNRVDNAG
jgi:hypothetical protein